MQFIFRFSEVIVNMENIHQMDCSAEAMDADWITLEYS